MRHSKDRCRNQKQTEFIYTTETTDVTLGMNQPSMIQINYPSKSKYQTLKPNPRGFTNLPSPPSPILKSTTPSPTVPVTITSTPIDAENIICIEDKTIWAHQERRKRENVDPPVTPPKTAPVTALTDDDVEISECPSKLPEDLDAIKEFIQHDKDDDYIPLMSSIALKKKKRKLFLPVEFNTIKIDALVDSGAYINAISERDAEKLRQHASQCIVNKAPHPLSKCSMPMLN